MFNWRITKYNPQYRNSHDVFLNDEWTSYSDIEKIFNNIKLTYDEYIITEKLYIQAILSFMNCNNITSLQIIELEKPKIMISDIHDTKNMLELFNTVKENDWITHNYIQDLCKLILRDKLWCKLYNQKMFVHFGWDFYMYIGSSLACDDSISLIQNNGLFVEPYQSPYETKMRP